MKKYINNYQLFLEKKKSKSKNEYGCLMVFFKIPKSKFKKLIHKIEKDDIYDKEGFGIEKDSHITLLYGLHDTEIEDKDVFDIAMKESYPNLILVNPSLFENPDYDVLKFDVKYHPDDERILHKVNKKLTKTFPYTTDFPKYHPHCTLAYLKSGKGKKYIELFKDEEINVKPNKIVYSKSDGTKKTKTL